MVPSNMAPSPTVIHKSPFACRTLKAMVSGPGTAAWTGATGGNTDSRCESVDGLVTVDEVRARSGDFFRSYAAAGSTTFQLDARLDQAVSSSEYAQAEVYFGDTVRCFF